VAIAWRRAVAALAEDAGAPQQAMVHIIACRNFTTLEDVRGQDGQHKPVSDLLVVLRESMFGLVRRQ
jgi:hypothetical protein